MQLLLTARGYFQKVCRSLRGLPPAIVAKNKKPLRDFDAVQAGGDFLDYFDYLEELPQSRSRI